MNRPVSPTATADPVRPPKRAPGLGQGTGHLVAPGVPERARPGPGQHGPVRPAADVAQGHPRDPVGQAAQVEPGPRRPAGPHVGGQAVDRLRGGVGPVHDQPGGQAQPVDRQEAPVARVEDLAVEGVEGQLQPLAQEPGEGRVGPAEGGVALPQGPDGAGQPVGGPGVGGVGLLGRGRAGVQGPVRLHPQHHVPGVGPRRGLEVGHAPQQLVGALAAGRVAGLAPVAEVHDRRPGHVVGVERPLAPGVGGRVVGAAPEAPVAAVRLRLGVGPQHPDLRLLARPPGGVPRLLRRVDPVPEEVEMPQVGQRRPGSPPRLAVAITPSATQQGRAEEEALVAESACSLRRCGMAHRHLQARCSGGVRGYPLISRLNRFMDGTSRYP